jgi:phosphatidylglycerol:prolipoprotein diacylglycerol transferase
LRSATITFPLFGDGFAIDLPAYFTIFGFNIYYYGLFITAGFAAATIYLVVRRELFGLTTDNILDILIIAVPCGLIGARIYYMIFNFDRFFAPGQWENILRFRDGGLAVYGGIIASGLVFIIYSRIKKIPLGNLLDAAGFGLFIGQAIGRWGNFINREAYGVETDLPWRMGLTARGVTEYYHPAFLYESIWNVIGLLLMHIFSKKSKAKYPGQYFLFYVVWYGLGRFMIEGLRTDSLLIPGTELRASQWLAAISFLTAAGILVYNHIRAKKDASVNAQDDEGDEDDINDDDIVAELAELDGACVDQIEKEDGEINEAEDDDVGEMVDLAELDGASAVEIEDETADEDE